MKVAMTLIEKVLESRRLIDYVAGLNMKDSKQLAEARITNDMIKKLNDEVEAEMRERVNLPRRIYTYLRVYAWEHVKQIVGWSVLSLMTLFAIEFTVKAIIYFWMLVW